MAVPALSDRALYAVLVITIFLFYPPPAIALVAGSQSYTTPGTYTFTVPSSYGTLTVQVWGGGGYGGELGGGGGGYVTASLAVRGLPPTVTITVGSGGSPSSGTGGTSSFGSYATAYGGGAGYSTIAFSSYDPAAGGTYSGGSGENGGVGAWYANEWWGAAPGSTQCAGAGGGSGSFYDFQGYYYPNTLGGTSGCGGNGGSGDGGAGSAPGGGGGAGDGPGAPGQVKIAWTNPAPTCTVTLTPNPSPYAATSTPVTLTWSSSNADDLYINNVGWVSASGSTTVASQANTDYSCYGYSAAAGDGPWMNATLTVTPPPLPTAIIIASSTSIQAGQSTKVTADFSGGSGDALSADNIDSPVGTGLGTTNNPDASKTITFSTTTPGTYSFYARLATDYYSSWATYATTTVTVTAPTTCTPSVVYGCQGNNIVATSTSATCAVTVSNPYEGQICTSPQFCESGSSSCLAPAITFNQSGSYTGDLQLIPNLLQSGETTQVHWSVSNAQSCTVTGTNGDSWSALSSPGKGETSKPILSQTTYTLSCTAYGSNPGVDESATVNVVPTFNEL